MAVTDRSVTSRTRAHHIESVTHHSVSARTIQRRLQQSGLSTRRPLLDLPLTQNHRRLHHQWCDERKMWAAEWNEVVTHLSATPRWSDSSQETPWREDTEQLRYAPPYWSCTGFFVNHQIELLPWPVRSPDLSPIENMWSMVAQRLTRITPPAATPDQLWQRVEAAWSAVP
ncbi:transposable element Tcb1 transposase [Trichonephila clavipes]|nr:transposable element Tcb1 transposase [Trichonephila clavipes]